MTSHNHHSHAAANHDGCMPTVYATRRNLVFAESIPAREVQERLEAFLDSLSVSLRNAGCTFVGHIKGVLVAEQGFNVFFSMTSLIQPPRWARASFGTSSRFDLTLNVIVFGVREDAIDCAVDHALALQSSFGPALKLPRGVGRSTCEDLPLDET